VFALSSGTIGGAMEAAVCGVNSIALSYAFFDRNHDPDIITGASDLAVRLIEHLYKNWDSNAHLYSVNIPLVEKVGERKILYTDMLQNGWTSGSCFQVIDAPPCGADEGADEAEVALRRAEEKQGRKEMHMGKGGASANASGTATPVDQAHIRYTHKHFKWSPVFKDVYKSVEDSEPGNDGWAVAQGFTSVTPLRANFMHVGGSTGKEIKLE
jgi:5'/3'-nucleotidase SurE